MIAVDLLLGWSGTNVVIMDAALIQIVIRQASVSYDAVAIDLL